MKTKQVVCGLGEIGNPIYKILNLANPTQGFDIDTKLLPKNNSKLDEYKTQFLHIWNSILFSFFSISLIGKFPEP